MRPRVVLKFGGSSLADAERFMMVAQIIKSKMEMTPLIVVSAVGAKEGQPKVTDMLKEIGLTLLAGGECKKIFFEILEIHRKLVMDLKMEPTVLEPEFDKMKEIMNRIESRHYGSREEALDAIMGYGEILSAFIMAKLLDGMGLDYTALLPEDVDFMSDDCFQEAVLLETSLEKIATKVIASRKNIVFPGYIGVTIDGRRTTLGRGGSDYTGGLMGAALKRDVEIWTDVDGIYRANPQYIPEEMKQKGHPCTIPELSYDEAYQMAAFGSRVLHKKTLMAVKHAIRKGKHIKLSIKNTFNPDHPGTDITSIRSPKGEARGITCLEGTHLLTFYPRTDEEAESFAREVHDAVKDGPAIVMTSRTLGRLSYVFERYHPILTEMEEKYLAHLSKDQTLIKIVGDGIGESQAILARIHNALGYAENPEKYGMTIIHKSPQLLSDNSFEFLAKKRGFQDVIVALYKDLFLENTVTVGVLGLGTVGAGVLRYAREAYSKEKAAFHLEFPSALVRDIKKARGIEFEGNLTTNPDEIIKDPSIDIILEVMGGVEPARTYVLEAIRNGKHVVTANKAMLAEHGPEIFAEAARYHRNLGFEASVCGEIPVVDDFLTFPGLGDVQGITGIVNGTSNYVLSRFMEGMTMEEAIRLAQDKGFAEADPTLDVSGADASQKLAILTSLLFNRFVDHKQIPRQGLEGLKPVDVRAAVSWGYTIKPLIMAQVVNEKLNLRVTPAFVDDNHPFHSVRNETNALALYLKDRDEPITKIGKGAGAIPTARSIVRDILEVARKSRYYMVDLPRYYLSSGKEEFMSREESSYRWYLRITVEDYPGIFARIAEALGGNELSIHKVVQEEEPGNIAHIIFQLKTAPEGSLLEALKTIGKMQFIKEAYSCVII
ncbi:MAG: homoserine dehydrogenase [Firmicutes bacterium]|nr:homoserine dehydrogenase [Bacillota bacterium]